ncbi:MAG: hypothetical protein WCD35_09120, partial [Mycobacteriales bacterium]
MVAVQFLPVLLVLVVLVLLLRHGSDPAHRAQVLRRAALVVIAAATVLIALFAGGEAFADPGGWAAVGLVLLWAVPLCLLAGFAWYRPDTAFPVLAVLTGLLVAVDVWAAASSD